MVRSVIGRWYAEERVGLRMYRRHPEQPVDGFDTLGEVMRWLDERSLIEYVPADDGSFSESYWRGWGDPWYARRESAESPARSWPPTRWRRLKLQARALALWLYYRARGRVWPL